MALECVWFLHLKIGVSGGLDIHFRENDEDILRRRGLGREKDAQPPHPVSPPSSTLKTMIENVCFLLTDKKIFALSKPP